jgi:uncharacterized Fe-S center protein
MGATIKNISMGVGSRAMKQAMHASVRPQLDGDKCQRCGACEAVCPEDAVQLNQGVPQFNLQTCVGCAECIGICPHGALAIQWNEAPAIIQEKMVEVAAGLMRQKKHKVAFFNFILEVTPDCDCFRWSDNPLVNNVGILAAKDPIAIDQAAAELIQAQAGLPNSRLSPGGCSPGADKFRDIYPDIDWTQQLAYGEAMGLGQRQYTLIEIE